MRVIERYATAALSEDLKDRGQFSDINILIAAGLSGISNSWASSLLRLKNSNDSAEYIACLVGAKNAARKLSGPLKWKISDAQIGRLAKKTLEYWIADICPTCLGRGAANISGTPMLEDLPCDQCAGTGRRKLPQTGNMAEYATSLLAVLDEAERIAGGMMMKRLADEMSL